MAELSTKPPFKHPSIYPKKDGLYVRDWRGTEILPATERKLHLDMWQNLPKGDIYGPGFWYVWPDWNDASEESLPWREATRAEKYSFYKNNPKARIT